MFCISVMMWLRCQIINEHFVQKNVPIPEIAHKNSRPQAPALRVNCPSACCAPSVNVPVTELFC